ncbi:hypothetical protein ACQEVB_40840 [Pseudonocardia sp. CA-107938]|uniref:hypothetical protein n=1 Tax=Pseudonocardia sp. CA-107938 TaxID=3240021 RepID=UPI003D914FB6
MSPTSGAASPADPPTAPAADSAAGPIPESGPESVADAVPVWARPAGAVLTPEDHAAILASVQALDPMTTEQINGVAAVLTARTLARARNAARPPGRPGPPDRRPRNRSPDHS